jgi:hypothetical protein
MFEYFYHEILRKTIIGFGSLFNDIEIKHLNDSGDVTSVVKVPLAYAPTQKFLARLEQVPDLNKPVQITLPRMSFEFVSLNYDATRKVTTTQTFLSGLTSDKKQIRKTYMPVPYNMGFELNIYTKLNDDMLQIIEQILPYFQPNYTLTIDLISSIGEKRDIPIVIEGISMNDSYEGNYETRRALIYTIRFVAKTYLFGPVSGSDVSKDIIRKVSVGYIAGEQSTLSTREYSYSVEPRATKNYTDNVATLLDQNIDNDDTIFLVQDASNIPEGTYIYVDEEEMFVEEKDGNKLTVKRGQDSTTATSHVLGSEIKPITSTDNNLIEFGDDFGFSVVQ